MAHVVVLGTGVGGIPMAYELREELRDDDKVTVISDEDKYQSVPSNPWLAVNWRKPSDIEVPLAPCFERKGIGFIPVAARRVNPEKNRIELDDGKTADYDYQIIATGPALAYEEVEGLGPEGGFTQSICRTSHAIKAAKAWDEFVKNPGPIVVGAVQGVSCFGREPGDSI